MNNIRSWRSQVQSSVGRSASWTSFPDSGKLMEDGRGNPAFAAHHVVSPAYLDMAKGFLIFEAHSTFSEVQYFAFSSISMVQMFLMDFPHARVDACSSAVAAHMHPTVFTSPGSYHSIGCRAWTWYRESVFERHGVSLNIIDWMSACGGHRHNLDCNHLSLKD